MADLNSISVTGNLTKDADFKTLPSGKHILECNVACNTGYGDYKRTIFFKVQQWGDSGERVAQYLTKGSKVACSGELQMQEWQSKQDGQLHTTAVISTNNIQIIQTKRDSTANTQQDYVEENDEVSF